ncbi:peroxisomal sarcosine oxidase-like [Paramuricea clavata]|uniref:Peroxisomal sarcosine oxidase-like n=1 Tax=Paramuricea clavata TaxID=317549 RepID=A0A6S7G2H6_PARCT|nr:peroxisomal sarcosine oxidase-like [Paramuricea clavata]
MEETMEPDKIWDCIVVGAGIEGSNTARYSASLGKKTLCLEQFPLPHSRGSSHGQSRITRHSYDKKYYADMMPEAFALWEQIERMAKEKLFINCGCLTIDSPPYTSINHVRDNLTSNGIKTEPVSNKELKEKYRLNFPSGHQGLLEPTGGMLLASKCLAAVQNQFVKFGGVLQDNEKVTDIVPGDIIHVKTNKGLYKTRKLILTPGPWASSLLRPLGIDLQLKPIRTSALYWKVKQSGFTAEENYPCVIDHTPDCVNIFNGTIYSLPCYEYPGMIKICLHNGPAINPDARDDVDYSWVEKNTSEYVRRYVMGVEGKPSITEHCIYTVSPDDDCTLDRHPKFDNIVIGVGFSGSGFKISPVVGKILFQLAFGLQPNYDMAPFKIARFQKSRIKSVL